MGVLQNMRVEGSFPFVRIVAKRGPSLFNLTVTEEHVTPRLSTQSKAAGLDFGITKARDLNVGDFVPVSDQVGRGVADVAAVEYFLMPHKHVLVTAAGTVLADGLLTTTVCDEYTLMEDRQDMASFLAKCRHDHAKLLYMRDR